MENSKPLTAGEQPLATLVITPNETFKSAETSLKSILAITPKPFHLIYVDAGSPRQLGRTLKALVTRQGWRYIRFDNYLGANKARNIGLREVQTKYVVFIDNDVVVAPGWLDALVNCAEETGSGAVGPLYCIGPELHQWVHMAGGKARIEVKDGQRVFHEQHYGIGLSLAALAPALQRQETDTVEFHCMLVRTDVLERLGPLDEALLTAAEHTDLCLAIREAGGKVFIEPGAVVTNLAPPPIKWYDFGLFLRRWNPEWNRQSMAHFSQKWELTPLDQTWQREKLEWLEWRHRTYLREPPVRYFRSAVRRLWGLDSQTRLDDAIDKWLTRLLVR